jgi:hypothetical protein
VRQAQQVGAEVAAATREGWQQAGEQLERGENAVLRRLATALSTVAEESAAGRPTARPSAASPAVAPRPAADLPVYARPTLPPVGARGDILGRRPAAAPPAAGAPAPAQAAPVAAGTWRVAAAGMERYLEILTSVTE